MRHPEQTKAGLSLACRTPRGYTVPDMKRALVIRQSAGDRGRVKAAPTPPPLRLRHYKHVYWMLNGGPWVNTYHAVVVQDGCHSCAVCSGTTDWFMEFARIARDLVGINLRDCLHWGSLHDNPRPLIAPASNLNVCNRGTLARLRKEYYRLPEEERPRLETVPPALRSMSQAMRFEESVAILARMIELWEDGQYIGWPS